GFRLRGGRFLSSFSSYAGSGTRETKAMREPSGDHTGSVTSSFIVVSRVGSPPSAGITYRSMCSPSRFDVKASFVPSGDHRGEPSRFSPEVNFRAAREPSNGTVQIAPRYSFASLSMLQTLKATVRPSGESLGSAAPASA